MRKDANRSHNKDWIEVSKRGVCEEVKETLMREEMQQACIRGLQDALVSKNSSNAMRNTLREDEDDSISVDDVGNDSAFDSSKAEEVRGGGRN